MSLADILIILACLAGGYWIVSSVMGSGVDNTPRDKPPTARVEDWHLLLDVPRSASRGEIEAAFKRQQNKALASGDSLQLDRLRLARETALAQLSRPGSLRQ